MDDVGFRAALPDLPATVVDEHFKDIITMLYAWESGLGGARTVEPQ